MPLTIYYYLSLKPFVDGQSMPVEHVAKIVGQPDVYDLGEHDSGELKSLKVLFDDETHLLLARTGIPFKIALVMPCEEPCLIRAIPRRSSLSGVMYVAPCWPIARLASRPNTMAHAFRNSC